MHRKVGVISKEGKGYAPKISKRIAGNRRARRYSRAFDLGLNSLLQRQLNPPDSVLCRNWD